MAPPDYKYEIIDPIKDRLPYVISALPFASGHWLTYYIDQFNGFGESSLMYRHQFKDQVAIKHCQSPHELRGHPDDYHIHHPITASMKATMVRNIDFEKIALLENNWGPYVPGTIDRYLEFKKINPKLKMIVSMDIIHCRFELAKKYQQDVSPERSNEKWPLWQEAFGDDVFRININKILDENVEHMIQLTDFLEADWHPNWQQLVRDYRKHINV